MMITVSQTKACSHGELNGIEYVTPKEVIAQVCADAKKTHHYHNIPNGVLFSAYVFSAAIMLKGAYNFFEKAPRYGDNLAEFIRKEKLGTVVETPEMNNVKFHRDHNNKVYVWIVDHDAVGKWYKDYVGKKVEMKGFQPIMEDYNDEVDVRLDFGAINARQNAAAG